jgi:hypothetical protein
LLAQDVDQEESNHPKLSDNSHHICTVPKSRERRGGERAVSALVDRYPGLAHSDDNGLDLGLLEVTDTQLANDGFELHAFYTAHRANAETKASCQLPACQELAGKPCQRGGRHDTLAKLKPMHSVPPYLHKPETIEPFQGRLREAFLGGDRQLHGSTFKIWSTTSSSVKTKSSSKHARARRLP